MLYLPIKKKWFDMIMSGKKTAEYREIKPYWTKRLFAYPPHRAVKLINGYGENRPFLTMEILRIRRWYGRIDWGAPKDKEVYIIELGNILDSGNL